MAKKMGRPLKGGVTKRPLTVRIPEPYFGAYQQQSQEPEVCAPHHSYPKRHQQIEPEQDYQEIKLIARIAKEKFES